ncbi:adenylate/guanylate cyclase domain-containing protein [Alphaproteobacteria bacterium]|jgi:adenylate cyclase|nr:adenylate/guanylate cyclase domain-containing protein [Alphaproteobacteria bacterium]
MNSLAQKLISQSAVEAERIIAIVRMVGSGLLCVALVFLLILMATEDSHVRSFELSFALATAMCYFALGAVSYFFAKQDRYKPWMSWLFAWIEVSLISLNIYSDVHEPNTSSLFALASPVTILIAIVMVVQVLRYNVKLLLWTQGSLLIIITFIVFHDPNAGEAIPAASVTELLFLYKVPPNIMRLVMFGILLMIIILSVRRSRMLIEQVALETEQIETQKRFLPGELIDRMGAEGMSGLLEAKEEQLAIMFIDVRGFTKLSEQIGPLSTATFLSKYRSMVVDAVTVHGGIVDKFIGDGALIVFGLNSNVTDGCQSAVAAGKKLFQLASEWHNPAGEQKELKLVVAIHAGLTMVGTIGDERRMEFTVTGSTVNLASRLETYAKDHEQAFIVSQAVVEHFTQKSDKITDLGEQKLRGFQIPVRLYSVNEGKDSQ